MSAFLCPFCHLKGVDKRKKIAYNYLIVMSIEKPQIGEEVYIVKYSSVGGDIVEKRQLGEGRTLAENIGKLPPDVFAIRPVEDGDTPESRKLEDREGSWHVGDDPEEPPTYYLDGIVIEPPVRSGSSVETEPHVEVPVENIHAWRSRGKGKSKRVSDLGKMKVIRPFHRRDRIIKDGIIFQPLLRKAK